MEHLDVLIVGAGLSGIGAAVHLQQRCPGRSVGIVEARERLGGTWDLFRYPGIRSDSDMYTLGYGFRPWTAKQAIADGASILAYLQDTAREYGVDRLIRYGQRVVRADWSSADARWTVEIDGVAGRTRLTCSFLFMCSGYYRYDAGHAPAFPGSERYAGRIVHPQHWPDDVDVAGKRVVIIGSGATAVTLAPALAAKGAQVTMLQRSPGYVVSRPSEDALAARLSRFLPARAVSRIARWQRILLGMYFYGLCKRKPAQAKRLILGGVRAWLGRDFDITTHFTPRYDPWDQRLCLVPDGDLFRAIRAGRVEMATDTIASFTERGIQLASGRELDADLVVTATGLELQVLGGLQASVDGVPVDWAETLSYKGMMFSGVPNLASATGYTNASWTLKCDLTCAYVCRLLNHMLRHGWRQCTPRDNPSVGREPWIDFSSGYVQRSMHLFPKQGSRAPWRLYQNYLRDLVALRYGRLDDGAMAFANAAPKAAVSAGAAAAE